MERIAVILVIFVLLMNGRHVERRLPEGERRTVVTAVAIPLDAEEPAQRTLGSLRYLGGWSLTARGYDFGGISSLHVGDTGDAVALSDSGEATVFTTAFRGARTLVPGTYRSLPDMPGEASSPKWRWDSESMAQDPATGDLWVGYELSARICRYSASFARYRRCAAPPAIRRWPQTTGIESLARLPDGRFLGIAEDAPGPAGSHEALLFAGDPADPATPRPLRLGYRAPEGYLPTDAVAISPDRMLVMNRRVTLFDGFTGILTLVDIRNLRAGTVLAGRVVARFAHPIVHDNFEALAISREGRAHILWVASDDNHLFFQRSLLLKFALPEAWANPSGRTPDAGDP